MAKINMDFYKLEQQEEISDINRVISSYIMAMDEKDYDKVIDGDPRVEVFLHLSSLRESTFSWYPFKEDATVLEIAGGFGALTGVLCEKAKHLVVTEPSFFRAKALKKRYNNRNNLDIFVGDVEHMNFPELFDYIVLCEGLVPSGVKRSNNIVCIQYVESLLRHLRPDGKILVAVDNCYSIYNWKDNDGGVANPMSNDTDRCRFHRQQLMNIAEGAGLKYQKIYYPMPNYHLVGCVYTDECLPTAEEWKRLGEFNLEGEFLRREDVIDYRSLLENDMFPFFSNSFFLEAGKTQDVGELKYAKVLSKTAELVQSQDAISHNVQGKRKYLIEQLKIEPFLLGIDQDRQQLSLVMQIQMDLLKQLKLVCDKYQLQFFMIYGTLLGAVRHGGMIPGDDDIDIALPRKDYNKLLKLEDEFTGKYFLQTPWNDKCFYGGYIKLRNKNTTSIQPQNWWVNCCEGIGIDIFPLDNGYQNKHLEKWKEIRICFYQRLLYAKSYGLCARFMDMPLLKWKAYKYLGKPFSREKMANRLNQIMAEGEDDAKSPFGIFAHYTRGRGYKRLDYQSFEEVINLTYEDMILPAPLGRHNILEMLYGEDYMQPQTWQESKKRHGFYRAAVPYQKYKQRFSGLMKPAPINQEIVLFGDGLLFEAYFERYKDRFIPKNIVLVEAECLVTEVHGIHVERFEDYQPEDRANLYPVICSVDIMAAETVLQQAGYKEYYIFVQNRNWLLYANSTYVLKEIRGVYNNAKEV